MWVLCVLKIPSLVKDALLENNALAGKRGFIANFPRYYCSKAIRGPYNHPVAVPGHAAREKGAGHVLR